MIAYSTTYQIYVAWVLRTPGKENLRTEGNSTKGGVKFINI